MRPEDQPKFALSVSDVLPPEMMDERLENIVGLSGFRRHMGYVCVRNDSLDGELFARAAAKVSGCGLDLILESDIVENLEMAADAVPDMRPVIMSMNGDQRALIGTASSRGLPIILTSPDLDELVALSAIAEDEGCDDIILCPASADMKQCLESTVALSRRADHGNPADRPLAVRAWCGEYALSMATVCLLRGGMLAILDDLNHVGCRTLDFVIDGYCRSGGTTCSSQGSHASIRYRGLEGSCP